MNATGSDPMTDIAPQPIALPPELEPPPTVPGKIDPVVGTCDVCRQPVLKSVRQHEGVGLLCGECRDLIGADEGEAGA
jgi:hypothetical protein